MATNVTTIKFQDRTYADVRDLLSFVREMKVLIANGTDFNTLSATATLEVVEEDLQELLNDRSSH